MGGARDGPGEQCSAQSVFLTPGNNAPHPQAPRGVVATTGPRQSPQAMTTGIDTSENVRPGTLLHPASHSDNSPSLATYAQDTGCHHHSCGITLQG